MEVGEELGNSVSFFLVEESVCVGGRDVEIRRVESDRRKGRELSSSVAKSFVAMIVIFHCVCCVV
jgi:hypothetical protein